VNPSVPYRNANTAAKGFLHESMTRISDVTDGLSNTIAIIECAGRDEQFVSQYFEQYVAGVSNIGVTGVTPIVRGLGPAPGGSQPPNVRHRFWRWADPGNAIGTSGQPNNKGGGPTSGLTPNEGKGPWPNTATTAGDQAGQNEEPFSYHSGGVNALFGDGSVKFIKETINLAAFRGILTEAGGEVVSSDQY
jgi:prepilin-type processing-associated H-X9-DG protein